MQKIKFTPEPPGGFYLTLKKRVLAHFRENGKSRYATKLAILKSLVFVTAFLSCYALILIAKMNAGLFLLCWFSMGVCLLLAAMSMVHDAAHGVYSSKKWVNETLLRFTNLVGGDGYMYKYKHTISHHPYTNIPGADIDLEQSGVVRVTGHTQARKKHRYQHVYMKLLYPFYILYWVIARDFDYYKRQYIGLVEAHHAPVHWFFLIFSKIFYFFYMLFIPLYLLPVPAWQVLLGFFCMHIGSGIVAMFALLTNHVVEDSLFVLPDENGLIQCSWGEHQLMTTDDYSPDSRIISFLFSGLNHHVAHHLFPKYCHIHYPAITKIMRATAAEFQLRYRHNDVISALGSHFRLLKQLSNNKKQSTSSVKTIHHEHEYHF
ncbi:MAG: fatty acid desaturase family protein [Flavisolibacter sp.]